MMFLTSVLERAILLNVLGLVALCNLSDVVCYSVTSSLLIAVQDLVKVSRQSAQSFKRLCQISRASDTHLLACSPGRPKG